MAATLPKNLPKRAIRRLARRSDEDGLNKLVGDIKQGGDEATGRLVNAIEDGAIEDLIADVEKNIGPIEVFLFNLGAQFGDRTLEETPLNYLKWAGA